jgi:peptidoglycan/LPS O-acetylase OafA/YrhL
MVPEFLRRRFTRVTSSVAYIPQLDGLRALAVLLVIGHHVFAIYLETTHRLGTQQLPRDWGLIAMQSPLVNWGLHLAFGVNLFFVISGFVLALPFARSLLETGKMPSVPLYLLRRVIRLEPPYLINMTILLLFLLLPWRYPHAYWVSMLRVFGPHYLWSIVYLHALRYSEASWVGGVAWTLEIEIQFYLLMPVLAQLFRVRNATVRRGTWMLLTIAAALFGQYVLPTLHQPRVNLSIAGHLEYFFAGILLADLSLKPPAMLKLGVRSADLLAVAGAVSLVYVLHWQSSVEWLEPFLVMAFYFGVLHEGLVGRLFRSPWLTIPGTMCYTIYLYHMFIIRQVMERIVRFFPPNHSLLFDSSVQLLLILPIILAISAVLYLAIERPFVVLSHTATRRWRPAKHPVVAEAAD